MNALEFVWKSALIIVLISFELSIRKRLGFPKESESRTFVGYMILFTGWRVLDNVLEYFKL
jgi:hypothetical protein